MSVSGVDPHRREQHLAPAPLLDPHRLEAQLVAVEREHRLRVQRVDDDVIETDDRVRPSGCTPAGYVPQLPEVSVTGLSH